MFDIRLDPDQFQVTEDEILDDLQYPAAPGQRRLIAELEALLRLEPAPER